MKGKKMERWKKGGDVVAKIEQWLEKENLAKLSDWGKRGLSFEEIALRMGIGVSTLYNWRKRYAEIEEALNKGREVADVKVENALFKRAVGFTTEEVTEQLDKSGELVVTKVVHKVVEPNVSAQLFWLKNRRPDLWGEKEYVGDGKIEVVLGDGVDELSK